MVIGEGRRVSNLKYRSMCKPNMVLFVFVFGGSWLRWCRSSETNNVCPSMVLLASLFSVIGGAVVSLVGNKYVYFEVFAHGLLASLVFGQSVARATTVVQSTSSV